MSDDSFLHVRSTNETCILCTVSISKNEQYTSNSNSKWSALKTKAEIWSTIKIPPTHQHYEFRTLHKRIRNVESAFGIKHENCRTVFNLQVKRYENTYGKINITQVDNDEQSTEDGSLENQRTTRSSSSHIKSFSRLCFICELGKGKKGRLRHCEKDGACKNLLDAFMEVSFYDVT